MTDKQIVAELANRNDTVLKHLIKRYQGKFIRWARKNRFYFDDEVLADTFIDALLKLYENILQKQFVWQENGGLQAYLFQIGRYKLINQLEKVKNRERHHDKVQHAATDWLFNFDPHREQEILEMADIIAQMMEQLGDSCQKLLRLFEFEGKSMREIADILGFESEQVAKSRKYQCLKQLRKYAKEVYSKDDFFQD